MDEFDIEDYFYPKPNIRIKSTKTEDFKLLVEIFFTQTFIIISLIYSLILLMISNYDMSIKIFNKTLSSVEVYLVVTLPAIIILLYQKYGFITLPSLTNAIYLLLYQDNNLPGKIDFVFVSINPRILLISLYVFIGYYMAYFRFNKLTDDGLMVYYLAYLSIIIKVLIEYFDKGGSGFLAIFMIIFITIFIFFVFQAASAFIVGFLIGLFVIRKRSNVYKSNFLYPSSDSRKDILNLDKFNY